MTPSAAEALANLRHPGATLQWYVVVLFAFVVYVYAVEIERRNWSLVFAGLAFWGMDWLNEIWNALVFHFTARAPVWGTPGRSALVILIGLNIEICTMFAVAGVVFAKLLPVDAKRRILGVPNRWFLAVANSIGCVAVELFLNRAGVLTWDWPFWNARAPWLIVLFGYLPFFLVCYRVFDMRSTRRQAATACAILAVDVAALLLFGGVLHWI